MIGISKIVHHEPMTYEEIEKLTYWIELWFKGTVTIALKKGSDNHSPDITDQS